MKRLSGLFWFTAVGGVLSSMLLLGALWETFTAGSDAMDALCRQSKAGCSQESLLHLYWLVSAAHVCGTFLLFWLAYKAGCALAKARA